MSIVDEITRLTSAKADIKAAIEAKGVTVPSSAHLDAFPSYVSAISGGGGGGSTVWDLMAAETFDRTVYGEASEIASNAFRQAFPSAASAYSMGLTISFPFAESIGSAAFYSNTAITHISFPNVKTIGPSCFGSCSYIIDAYLPEVTTIQAGAFASDYRLQSVYVPKLTTLSGAFYYCSALQKFSAPLLQSINGAITFVSCINLSEIYAPLITYISSSAFASCSALKSVNFPYVSVVDSGAFSRCVSLSVAYLGQNAASVKVSNNAFFSCVSLVSLYLLGSLRGALGNSAALNTTPIGNSTYLGYFGSIYVRASLLSAYKSSTNWTYFSSRFAGLTDEEIAALPTP